ncbi:MAG TPA: biotin/lipoyl-binding protein, partial [Longimicrobium sp.]|nr:biotin/lipoyl-binding protein [Longimicrobium sp.]
MRHKGMMRALAAGSVLVMAACGRESDAAVAKGPTEIVLGPEAIEVASTREVSSGPTLSGTLAAERQATVTAQLGGTVLQVSADRGQPVRAGQTLGRIDD